MLKEFRQFLVRGNLLELAVAFVMGAAFAALVSSLVTNLVMPVVAMVAGKADFSGLTFTLNDAVFRYGSFVTDTLTFVVTGAAIFFLVVKPVNAIASRRAGLAEEPIVPDEERRHQELLAALRSARG